MAKKRLSTCFVILVLTVMGLSLTGCGEEALPTKSVSDMLPSSCKFNVEKIKEFEDPKAAKEINCLEKHLTQFAKGVKRKDDRYIYRDELGDFVRRFVPELEKNFEEDSKLLFLANSVIFRSPQNRIAVRDLSSLFDLLRRLNQVFSTLDPILKEDSGRYWSERRQVERSVLGLKNALKEALSRNRLLPSYEADIVEFLQTMLDDEFETEFYKAVSTLKKPLVGGNVRTLSSNDLWDLVDKIDVLAMAAFDTLKVEEKNFNRPQDKNKLFVDIIESVRPVIYNGDDADLLLENKNVVLILKEIDESYYNEDIEESLGRTKVKLVGGDDKGFSYNDFMKLLDLAVEIFQVRHFADVSYEIHRSALEAPDEIESIEYQDHADYLSLAPERKEYFWKIFEYVVTKQRTFRREDDSRSFKPVFERTQYGVTESSMLYWIADFVVELYGRENEKTGRKFFQEPEMENVLNDAKGLLIAFDLWTADFRSYVDGFLQSSDIFRTHSDGNIQVEAFEAYELLDHVFSSLKLADQILETMDAYCTMHETEWGPGFMKKCFRDNLPHVLLNDLNRRDDFPGIVRYWDEISYDEYHAWIDLVEEYTAISPEDDAVMFREEIARVMQGVADVESIIMADDTDGDGILSNQELKAKTYYRYKAQIQKSEPMLKYFEGITKSVFLYIIKTGEEPSITKALTYHLFDRNKDKVTATRMNISNISSQKGGFSVP